MKFEQAVKIDAPAAKVWETLVDVERWPEWTPSTAKVEIVEGRPLGLESKVYVKQPKLRALEWEIVEFEPEIGFTWRSAAAGVTTLGTHRITAADSGVTVALGLDQTGFLAPILGGIGGGLVRRYIAMEADGLKQRCES